MTVNQLVLTCTSRNRRSATYIIDCKARLLWRRRRKNERCRWPSDAPLGTPRRQSSTPPPCRPPPKLRQPSTRPPQMFTFAPTVRQEIRLDLALGGHILADAGSDLCPQTSNTAERKRLNS